MSGEGVQHQDKRIEAGEDKRDMRTGKKEGEGGQERESDPSLDQQRAAFFRRFCHTQVTLSRNIGSLPGVLVVSPPQHNGHFEWHTRTC